MRIRWRGVAVLALVIGSVGNAQAQTNISTPGGGGGVGFWGKDIHTFGQTFTTPTDAYLNDFSFWMSAAPDLQFQAYVFAWDQANLRATGGALFASAVMSGPSGDWYDQVSVNTGSLLLNPGSMYVAFLSTSGLPGSGSNAWQWPGSDAYTGGAFVYIRNGDDQSQWTNSMWGTNSYGVGTDLRFDMNFSPNGPVSVTPEPVSMSLLGTGLAAVASLRRRRKTQSA